MAKEPVWSLMLAETLMKRFPDPASYPFRDWCYPQGFVLVAFERLWETTHDARYRAYVLQYANDHVAADGSIRGFTGSSLDDIMAGSILVWAWQETGENRYRVAARRVRAAFDDYPRTAGGGFWHGRDLPGEMWVDGVFMGMMFLLRYGAHIDDQEHCFSEAVRQLEEIERRCRKEDTGLLYHAWSEDRRPAWADKRTGLSPEVWSEGLGWYALILAETADFISAEAVRGRTVRTLWTRLLEGLLRVQDVQTGLWYQVVDKGDRPENWHDTSGSAMFTYSLMRASEHGLENAAAYRNAALRGYRGIIGKAGVNGQGLVDIRDACDGVCVQNAYADYIDYPKKLNAKEAVAAFLWATWIVEKPGGAGT